MTLTFIEGHNHLRTLIFPEISQLILMTCSKLLQHVILKVMSDPFYTINIQEREGNLGDFI